MAEVATEEYAKETREFVNLMARGPKLVKELPKSLQEPAFLDHMLNQGRIEFGRPDHSWTHANLDKTGTAQDGPAGAPKLAVHKEFSWSNLNGPHCKTLGELLAEDDELDPALHLRVRLVNKRR